MVGKPGFQLLNIGGANVLAYELNEGEVTDDELAPYWERFDEALDHGMRLRVYAEMHALPKFGDGLVVEKLNRLENLKTAIERIAIVGDEEWLARYAKEIGPLMGIEVRHFSMADRKEAQSWILR